GNDSITTGFGNDTLIGGDGDDTLAAGEGVDSIDAGAGDDRINISDGGGDTVHGGTGRDRLIVRLDINTPNTADEDFTFDPRSTETVTLNDGLQFDGIEELIYYGGTGADRVEVVLYDE
ncbi:calcium-binding protein, partial [Cognatishimia sp. F0-27]|uniref:calcium-binding protein n=1 Tax=Cognatishimia sp. F0-27 TaxID=2816855 RepID=UPI001D733931|nr:type I secretion protein [Cognatishimia sp. F0-27]